MMPYWKRYVTSLLDSYKEFPHFVQAISVQRAFAVNAALLYAAFWAISRPLKSEMEMIDDLYDQVARSEFRKL